MQHSQAPDWGQLGLRTFQIPNTRCRLPCSSGSSLEKPHGVHR